MVFEKRIYGRSASEIRTSDESRSRRSDTGSKTISTRETAMAQPMCMLIGLIVNHVNGSITEKISSKLC